MYGCLENRYMKKIPNHTTSTLSELDMKIVHSVPPGGNWKNIPHSIPSNRLKNIRISFAQGKGSRSTYYGRLRNDMPSYTINTYFNRPGNGCHIHYEQNRTLSQREAARLQSFPYNFLCVGSQGSINKQIGNAVPPLLAYNIARSIGKPAFFIDLFCGAGGMGLGFQWAGWKPIVANDIDKTFASTYAANIHNNIIIGSITEEAIMAKLVQEVRKFKKVNKRVSIWVLGGPPCQGFSTAGDTRTMCDPRNNLFREYTNFLERIKPDGFVFENVTGLLNMDGGKIFSYVKNTFRKVMPTLTECVLNSVHYAIPQRRERVILIGARSKKFSFTPPSRITSLLNNIETSNTLKPAISVGEALSDLPPLDPGEDGSRLSYSSRPKNCYQKFMRDVISPKEYIHYITNDMQREFSVIH